MDMDTLVSALKEMPPVSKEKAGELRLVKDMLDIYVKWDGDPKTLDLGKYTTDDVRNFIDILGEHTESGFGHGVRENDLVAINITTNNLMSYLAIKQKPAKTGVGYI